MLSWGDAARFVNWLSNGQPTGGQTLSTTEDGSYRLNGITGDVVLNRVTRKASATWVLPTESEWYKAAYYDPAASHYWGYAIGTDSPPASAPPSSAPNMSNYNSSITGYALTGSSTLDPNQNYLTDVGAYTSSASPYGTFDQSGNVEQWTETLFVGALNTYRISSGANWRATDFYLMAGVNAGFIPTTEFNGLGLRVALVPEPGTVVLLAIGGVIGLVARRRYDADA